MSKFIIDFNKRNSKLWLDDEKYNEMLINNCIKSYDAILHNDGIVLLKDVLKSLGFDIKKFNVHVLTKYWTDDVDITYVIKGNGVYTLIFEADDVR